MKTLLIVESPAKAKTISKYLGEDFIVRASYGHVADLAKGGMANTGIDVEKGFVPKYVVLPEKQDKVKTLLEATRGIDQILLASDPDREGEAIAWHLNELLQKTNLPIRRVCFKELTKKAILKDLENLREIDLNLFISQQARRVIDRLVGFLVSPFLSSYLSKSLSAGRVQSVAVRLIAEREQEITDFQPEKYFNILAQFKKKEIKFIARNVEKITDQETADKISTALNDKNHSFIVTKLDQTQKKIKALPPLITSSLAGLSSSVYKFPTAKTMQLAQNLYEAGLITYMRTDSVRVSPEAVSSCKDWLKQNNYKYHHNDYKTKESAQDAHEAIRPTNVFLDPSDAFIDDEAAKVYRLIWERFIASQMEPAVYDITSVVIGQEHPLKASGKTLKSPGWQAVCQASYKGDNDSILPELTLNEQLKLDKKIKVEKKQTQPPPRYNEKTLIEELEKKEIGRPSTYAAILSKISDKGYVSKKGESYQASALGKKISTELVKFFSFMEFKYTAGLEKQLDLIAEGKLEYLEMMQSFYNPFNEELKNAYAAYEKDYGFVCNNCERYLQLKKITDGYILVCNSCRVKMFCDVVEKKIVLRKKEAVPDVICNLCGDGMFKVYGQYGCFYSCVNFPLCGGKLKEYQVIVKRLEDKKNKNENT